MMRYIKINWMLIRNAWIRDSKISGYTFASFAFQVFGILFSLLFFNIIFSNIKELGGWNFYEVLFLYAFSQSISAISAFGTKKGLNNLATKLIRTGDLDFYLTKPLNSMVYVSISAPRVYLLLSLIFHIGIAVWAIFAGHLVVTSASVLWFIFLTILANILFYFIRLLTVIPGFWLIRLWSLQDITDKLVNFMRYPATIYPFYLKVILMIALPVLTTAFVPVATLFNPPRFEYIVFMVLITVVFGAIANFFWNLGLKHYGSASS